MNSSHLPTCQLCRRCRFCYFRRLLLLVWSPSSVCLPQLWTFGGNVTLSEDQELFAPPAAAHHVYFLLLSSECFCVTPPFFFFLCCPSRFLSLSGVYVVSHSLLLILCQCVHLNSHSQFFSPPSVSKDQLWRGPHFFIFCLQLL